MSSAWKRGECRRVLGKGDTKEGCTDEGVGVNTPLAQYYTLVVDVPTLADLGMNYFLNNAEIIEDLSQ